MRSLDVLGFSHIGFVVRSVEEFRATWGTLLGIDDWLVRDTAQTAGLVQLHGELIERPSASRVAFARIGGTAIELIEPVTGRSRAAEWLRTHGAGLQHVAMWVNDLPAELARLDGDAEVSYSPAALHPALAARPVAATVTGADAPLPRPPFWAYVEPLASEVNWTLELLDARFAAAYREFYGDYPYYPGDLPGSAAPAAG
jgi:catechol 2,3-dioxygenase-like lactoylglutathione lyase family enzyme